MTDQMIECPQCAAAIPLTDALTEQVRHQLEGEMRKQVELQKKELERQQKELQKAQASITEQVQKQVEAEKNSLWKKAQEKAQEKIHTELQDLQQSNKEKQEAIDKMRNQELELRKEKRDLEEREKNMKLELTRQLDEERNKIAVEAEKNATEAMRLKMAEKDKQMEQLQRSLEEARRKSEQGSMQIQGDVQEDDLKHALQAQFAVDVIEDVPTGVKGADLVQTVRTQYGNKAGILLWESKNTKTWSDDWIKKLKGDQALVKADVCILVSQALPDDIDDFAYRNGVWVCSYSSALSLAAALRLQVLQINQLQQSMVGKDEKMEIMYNYLSGSEFRNRIENIVTAFTSMQSDLETEKRSMQRIWKKREKEIERVVMSTSGMYGDLQGIIGAALPTVAQLELPGAEPLDTTEE